MAEPVPFTTFNFRVEIDIAGGDRLTAGFSECSGLEISMEYESFREGGENHRLVLLPKQAGFGRLNLRRGMSSNSDLWRWVESAQFSVFVEKAVLLADVTVTMLAADGTPSVEFRLSGCVPTKIKAPSLNATSGGVAIEELDLMYESMRRV